MAVETNIRRGEFLIGANFTFRVLVTSDGTADGVPTNMTGYSLLFVLKVDPDRPSAVVSKTTSGATISLASVNGTNDAADITIIEADTLNLLEGVYHWALWRTDGANDRPLAWGTVELTQTASQATS